jgi:hypothetical protein
MQTSFWNFSFIKQTFVSVVFVVMTACGGGSDSDLSTNTTTDAGTTTDSVVGGNVTAITLESGVASSVDLSDISASESVVLALYAYNEAGTSEGFTVGSSENAQFLVDEDIFSDEVALEDEDPTETFHNQLIELAALIPDEALEADGQLAGSTTPRFATLGTTRSFKVLNTFSGAGSYDTVTATLRYQTNDFEFYVDDRDASSLDAANLEALATNFANVLPAERNLYGRESDVDSNGKFAVLFTHTVNELASGSGGIVTGFFYALDLFDTSQYAISNEMEVYYSFVPDPDGDYGSAVSKDFSLSNILPGVLVHEYQHMINFNEHYFVAGGSAEMSFLNEGLSHLAEDIYSSMLETGIENPVRVKGFLENVSNVCFSCGSSLNQRGGSYLFFRYLYEQAEIGNLSAASSGAALIQRLLQTDLRGIENIIHATHGDVADSSTFKTLLGRFGLAVYLSNTGETTNNQLEFSGINLRSVQDDNRGTVLNGPAVQSLTDLPFTDTVLGSSLSYIQISGQTIIDNGGTIPLSFSTDADFGGYLIR